jgi:formate hydrogenlyase transcriptional activator
VSSADARRTDDELSVLRSLVAGTAAETGDDFFRTLVRHLAEALHANHAFVAEFVPPGRARMLAYWSNRALVDPIEFDLHGTPCEEVVHGGLCHIPSGVQARYPEKEPGIESYLGAPLLTKDGAVLGHLCVLDEQPMPPEPRELFTFQIFAARAAAEVERLRLQRDLRVSEERYRDLFDEAPIAYVIEDFESRFIRANRTAQRILGIRPEEVKGMIGKSLIPDDPDAQRRVKQALESLHRGVDTSGVILELRRKDNGKPIFIQWWSRPDPSGDYTRTMFVDITERVLMEREQARLQAQNVYLQEEIKSEHNFDEIVGASAGLVDVLDNVRRVAPTDATVLIWGETGTGKELIARAIHSASQRADKPFVKVNCAALPAGLIESELFGHERGAFSGALQRRIGRCELASSGTIFLDEVGEIPLDVQVKLLRVLQEREFDRVGGNQTIRTDARVIAATNRLLPQAIAEGKFRADLFYRLNVFPINLPPLRERKQDIPLLAQFFVQKYAPKVGRRIEGIDPDTIERLTKYHWPGNIRELENIIERALILARTSVLEIDADVLCAWTPAPAIDPAGTRADEAEDLNSVQRNHILNTLRQTNWVVEGERGAAAQLGMKPATLRHRMKKLGIARSGTPHA